MGRDGQDLRKAMKALRPEKMGRAEESTIRNVHSLSQQYTLVQSFWKVPWVLLRKVERHTFYCWVGHLFP